MPNTIFDRLTKNRPTPVEGNNQPKDPAQQLLNWLQKSGRQKITARDVRRHASHPLRSREGAIDAINVLVRHGWLVPITPSRRDRPEWGVVRRVIIHPLSHSRANILETPSECIFGAVADDADNPNTPQHPLFLARTPLFLRRQISGRAGQAGHYPALSEYEYSSR